jgi:hypothetical protein
MGRRSNEKICEDLRKERGQIYSRRTRIIKKLSNPKFKGSNRLEADKAYKTLQKRLDAIREQLFRCGKKYANYKGQRIKLRKHQQYLQTKVNKLREEFGKAKTKAEKKRIQKEINIVGKFKMKTGEQINQIERTMKFPIGDVKSSEGVYKGITSIKGGKFVIQAVIWEMTDGWNKWLASGYFDTLVLDDEIFDISDNPMIATAAVYQAYDWALAWQHIYGSPFFFAYGDAINGYLEIKVKQYTTNLYDDEIRRHGSDIGL